LDSGALVTKETIPSYRGLYGVDPQEVNSKIPLEIIAGKPLETGTVVPVKPVDSIQVTPRVSTRYELRVIHPLKRLSWTRSVEVNTELYTVLLYEYENYKGEFMRFTTDAPDIGHMSDRVSSIKIIGNCGVRVYSAPGFAAAHQEFPISVPSLRGTWIGNDTISSLKIIPSRGVEQ
ncbi:MAG TPA: peptidase inhibitor family I36 protein, partial [Candidatus Deferrimicrobium sp.]|nr:peptidase inhibitor family I36 protein [Candidatus Deferrimicrobium sp.]